LGLSKYPAKVKVKFYLGWPMNGVLIRGDDVQPFLNCMALSNQGSCGYLYNLSWSLPSWSLNHLLLFVVLCLGWSFIYVATSTVPLILRWVNCAARGSRDWLVWSTKGEAEPT
jgi:hypothetical protein